MKKVEDGWFHLELVEVIRMNQLVRGKIDLDGFTAWYEQLSQPEQCMLIYQTVEFAYRAGVDEGVWSMALVAINLENNHPIIEQVLSFLRRSFPEWTHFHNWLAQLSDSDRLTIFNLAVYLFGIAEGRAYGNEEQSCCNHWWHRDLLDERVVRDLLRDPKFHMTSMKDDERIKSVRQ
jgi:hypothetical protein